MAPLADYHHCASHCLNLSASKTIDIVPLKSCCETVGKVISFFHRSSKNSEALVTFMQNSSSIAKKKLVKLCNTRFVERHRAILCFSQLLPFILDTVENMQTWKNQEVKSTAYCYPGAQPGGGIWGNCPPKTFKTLHSRFDICRNFQRINMKFYILINFKISCLNFSLACSSSPHKIYLEKGYLIENFVNDWYSTTNMLEVSTWEIV